MADLIQSPARVLIIEDEEPIRFMLQDALEDIQCEIVTAANGVLGLKAFETFRPEVVLIDGIMPLMDGFETSRRIRATEYGANVPILMITALNDIESIERAFAAGVSDFIPKPILLTVLQHRVLRLAASRRSEVHLRENEAHFRELNGRLSEAKNELEGRVHQRTEELRWLNERLLVELQERKQIQEQPAYDVLHDALTGLTNRTLFLNRLAHVIDRSKRPNEPQCAALFLDLDRFKTVNDSLGHMIGDQLLVEVARRLERSLRPGDTVARFGGDESALLLEDVADWEDIVGVANRIQAELSSRYLIHGHSVVTSASIGIALVTKDYLTPEEVLRDADIAMYRAKAQGKARFAVFEPIMHAYALANMQLEADLRNAVEHQEWTLHYQPIVALASGGLIGVEALIRWQRPEIGLVSPGEFIQVAEETGLIVPIGEWVLSEACAQVSAWRAEGLPELFVSVNLTARQFHDPHLVDTVRKVLDASGLPPGLLQLEITESSLVKDVESAIAALHELKALGVHLSIDDFGIGYSSLNYLQRFPLTTIKIDRSFVRDVNNNPSDAGIVTAIIAMAHRLNLKVVAEGVEFDDQVSFLRPYDCDAVQGYLYSPPVSADTLRSHLTVSREIWTSPKRVMA